MIDRFGKGDFEAFLEYLISGDLAQHLAHNATVLPLGLKQGEYCYKIPLPNNAWLWFRSSVDNSGFAADSGQDSIRLWVADVAGQPLLGKKQRWVTRLPGWRGRLEEQVVALLQEWKRRGELIIRMRNYEGRAIFSRYDGFCKLCRQPFDAGEPIRQTDIKGRPTWVHFECPPREVVLTVPLATMPTAEILRQAPPVEDHNDALESLSNFFSSISVTTEPEEIWEHDCPDNGDEPTLLSSITARVCTCGASYMDWKQEQEKQLQPKFLPSKYQQDIFDWIEHGSGNGVVEAVAGSGKTTTLVEALNHIPVIREPARFAPDLARDVLQLKDDHPAPETIGTVARLPKVIFLAFNKHIVTELLERQKRGEVPKYIQISTLHSLGRSNLVRLLQVADTRSFIDKDKLSTVMNGFESLQVQRWLPTEIRMRNILRRQLVSRLVSLCKGTMLDALQESRNTATLWDMIDRYGIEVEEAEEEDLLLVPQVLQRCAENFSVIDFDDMCWLPIQFIQLQHSLEKFDFVLVDEAQDLNKVQIQLVLHSIAPGGRVLAVGDRHQSLYGFRGADTEAIPRLIEMLHAQTLPLSICYRCPTSHVYLAQAIVPQIEARPDAPEGIVAEITSDQVSGLAAPGDMIICRTNAPLVPLAYKLIRRGVKATVRGREIGAGLLEMLDKFQPQSLGDLALKMREYLDRETVRLSQAEKWEQLQNLQDRCETIDAVAAESTTVEDLRDKLLHLFSDQVSGVVLSSIHRAKGLQANRVFLLRPDLLPHPMAKKPWQQVQELNAKYVALTRSKNELLFVED